MGSAWEYFSFLLLWEKMLAELYKKFEDGDLSEWPLSPDVLLHYARLQLVRGPEDLVQKYKDLYVRSAVVKKLADIYIDGHVANLKDRPGVRRIHELQKCRTVADSLKKHATQRVEEHYPEANA